MRDNLIKFHAIRKKRFAIKIYINPKNLCQDALYIFLSDQHFQRQENNINFSVY